MVVRFLRINMDQVEMRCGNPRCDGTWLLCLDSKVWLVEVSLINMTSSTVIAKYPWSITNSQGKPCTLV